jgi:acyl-coenzyme A thioesterase 13
VSSLPVSAEASESARPPKGFVPVDRRSPFLDLIGPLWVRAGEGDEPAVYGLRVARRHTNARGTAHGGMLMTMADLVLGYTAAFSQKPPVPLTTASMSMDFAGSAVAGDWLEGRADLQRVGRKLAFVNAYLSVDDRRIIRASAVFAVSPRAGT